MKLYFSHIKTSYTPKNQLQQEILDIANRMNHILISSEYPDVSMQQFQETLSQRIALAHQKYPDLPKAPFAIHIPSGIWSGSGTGEECMVASVVGVFRMLIIPVAMNELDDILMGVCHALSLDIKKVKSPDRDRELVEAKHIYCRRAKETTTASLKQIGSVINRDHATVLHGIKNCHDIREVREKYETIFNEKTKSKTKTMAGAISDEGSENSPQKQDSLLPHEPLEARVISICQVKSVVPALRGKGSDDTRGNNGSYHTAAAVR